MIRPREWKHYCPKPVSVGECLSIKGHYGRCIVRGPHGRLHWDGGGPVVGGHLEKLP